MSWENLKDAYRTRLGNLTAKSVLVLMVDEANAEGLALVGLERIATLTEINRRTVLRIVQVFGEIGVAERTKALLKGRLRPAFQVNLAKLGLDLREEFACQYSAAQRKAEIAKCRRDTAGGVAETRGGVSATRGGVAETQPPHPHKGMSLLVPLVSPLPGAAAPEGWEKEPDLEELDPEQLAHLGRCRERGGEDDARKWEVHYREENRAAKKAAAEAADRERLEAERVERLKTELGTVAAARAYVMRECGFVESRRGGGIGHTIEAVLRQEMAAGRAVYEAAPKMAANWNRFRENLRSMAVKWGPVKFLELGLWRDEGSWPWDTRALEREKSARTGSY